MRKRLLPGLLLTLFAAGVPHAASAQREVHEEFRQCLAAAKTELERSECHWQKAEKLNRLSK